MPRGLTAGRAGGRVRAARRPAAGPKRSQESFRRRLAPLPPADPAAAADCRRRAGRRPGSAVAGSRRYWASRPRPRARPRRPGSIEFGGRVRFRHPLGPARRSTGPPAPPERQDVAPRAGRGHRSRARSRSPGLASRARGDRPGRGCRGRARALGRPGAGPRRCWRPRRRSCERAAELTPDPARRAPARAGRRTGPASGRRIRRRRCDCSRWPQTGPLDELRHAPRRAAARPDSRFASSRGRGAAAPAQARPDASNRSMLGSPARPTCDAFSAGADRRPSGPRRECCRTVASSAARSRAAGLRRRRVADDLLLDGTGGPGDRGSRRRRPAAPAGALQRVRAHESRLATRGTALAAARLPCRARPRGTTRAWARSAHHADRVGPPGRRTDRASARAGCGRRASRPVRRRAAPRARVDGRGGAALARRPASQLGAVRSPGLIAAWRGREAEAERADPTSPRRRWSSRGEGQWLDRRPTGRAPCSTTASAATRRRSPRPSGRAQIRRARLVDLGAGRADRGRGPQRDARARTRRALARLTEITQRQRHATGRSGSQARSRALLSDGEAAEPLYLEAIERLGRTRVRAELARAHLLYGEWLRRQDRRVDAREQLRTAHEMLDRDGRRRRSPNGPVASCSRPARRSASAPSRRADELTAQETQIARLAGDGRTNPEIGAQLFISPRTVEWHLRKVFPQARHQLPQGAPRGPARPRPGTPVGLAPRTCPAAPGEHVRFG